MNFTETKKAFHASKVEVAEHLSDQYAPISTDVLLAPFLNKGWEAVKRQKGIGKSGKLGKELVILEHNDFKYLNGDSLQVICSNSFNGGSALSLMGGYGRLVCTNGLVIGDLEGGRFVHRGLKIYDKIENAYERIVAHLKKLGKDVDKLKEAVITPEKLEEITLNIAKRIFESDSKKKSVKVLEIPAYCKGALHRPRRNADVKDDAFTKMNVLQENIIRNGYLRARLEIVNKETSERTTETKSKQRNESKLSHVPVNKIIVEEFLKGVA